MVGLAFCFFFSGCAALLYQTAWLRQFAAVFGTSDLAVAAVLAAYMGGLALGAWVAGRYLERLHRPVLTYGLLEAAIALGALAVPWLLQWAGMLYAAWAGGLPAPPNAGTGQALYYLAATFVIIVLPAGCMGATLPLLTRYAVHSDAAIGPRVGLLYMLNTVGAVAGTLVAAFVLLPGWGLQITVLAGVVINGLVCALAILIAQGPAPQHLGERAPEAPAAGRGFGRREQWILPLIACSGATSFLYEIFWTRLLSHLLGGTIYSFAIMLAAFLGGLALGGGLSGWWATDRRRAVAGFALAQVATAVLAAGAYSALCALDLGETGLAANALLAVLVILPSALCIGATFPLAVRICARAAPEAGPATARIYTWNTAGAITGSVLAGFYFLPALGFAGSLHLAVGINLTLALAALVLIAPPPGLRIAIYGCLGIALLALYRPAPPTRLLDSSVVNDERGGRLLYSSVGRSSTVLVKSLEGSLHLRTNGLPEAGVRLEGAPPEGLSQHWLMTLPLLARPQATTALAVGLGGGVLLEDLPPSIASIDVVELEPEVLAANRLIGPLRHSDPLQDARIKIVTNDARNALALSARRYDIIVSQPSHPWTAGASHLYTDGFVGLVKSRLHQEGVFVQWMSAHFADAELMRSLCATLGQHFLRLRVYQADPGTFLLLASDGRLELEKNLQSAAASSPAWRAYLERNGLYEVEDLLVALALDEAGARDFAGSAAPITDDLNPLASANRYVPPEGDDPTLFDQLAPFDPLLRKAGWVHRKLGALRLVYLARRLIDEGYEKRALRLTQKVADRARAHQIQGYGFLHQGKPQEAAAAFAKALALAPEDEQAVFPLIKPHLTALAQNRAPEEIDRLVQKLPPSGRAVVESWRLAKQGNWIGLTGLDSLLAATRRTDAWYMESVLLRINWRTRMLAKLPNEHLLQKVRALIDAQLNRAHVVELLYLRQIASRLSQDTEAYIATTWRLVAHFEVKQKRAKAGRYHFTATEKESGRQRLEDMIDKLSDEEFTGRAEADALRPRLRALLVQLDEVQAPGVDRARENSRRIDPPIDMP